MAGLVSKHKGRDASAIGDIECSIFVLPEHQIQKIKDNFEDIYQEMLDLAIKRFKNHQILIAKEVKAYILKAKMENYSNNSSDMENYGQEDSDESNSDINSLNSVRLE